MKERFTCETCGKDYHRCKCRVYMSRYRVGRTRPLPEPSEAIKAARSARWRARKAVP